MADSGVNATAAALLGLLHDGPMTGGQLMAAAQRRLGPYWSMTRSQVYRELPALADAGLRQARQARRPVQPAVLDHAGRQARVRALARRAARPARCCAARSRCGWRSARTSRPPQLQQAYAQATEYHTGALNEAREQAKEAKKDGDEFGAAVARARRRLPPGRARLAEERARASSARRAGRVAVGLVL